MEAAKYLCLFPELQKNDLTNMTTSANHIVQKFLSRPFLLASSLRQNSLQFPKMQRILFNGASCADKIDHFNNCLITVQHKPQYYRSKIGQDET